MAKALFAGCPLPRLWGLNLLGTSLRVYVGDVAAGRVEFPAVEHRSSHSTPPSDFFRGVGTLTCLLQKNSLR